ncbi:MAG: hypothetical protein Q7R70_02760 [Candidatus Diapherotrites archaeon]|nr:hypothetical protein [Candidatus Diapherotrites archaeon]
MKEIFAILGILAILLLAGCAQQEQVKQGVLGNSLDANFKALAGNNKKLQAQVEGLELKVGVYQGIDGCKEKALVNFVEGNSIVQKTTLKDAFDRCNALFSTMKALAERG